LYFLQKKYWISSEIKGIMYDIQDKERGNLLFFTGSEKKKFQHKKSGTIVPLLIKILYFINLKFRF